MNTDLQIPAIASTSPSEKFANHLLSRFPDLSFYLLSRLPKFAPVAYAISSAITVAGAVPDSNRFPYYLERFRALIDVCLFNFLFMYDAIENCLYHSSLFKKFNNSFFDLSIYY